jgi:hypothetical protein
MATIQITQSNLIDDRVPTTLFIGTRSGTDQDDRPFSETYYGASEFDVLNLMVTGFAAAAFDAHPAASCLQSHLDIRAVLARFGITPIRAAEVFAKIHAAGPGETDAFSSFFSPQEIARGYVRFNPDVRVEVFEYKPVAVTTFNNRKPATIDVIYYDTKNGMAIAREFDNLVGYYPLENAENPHPDDYAWKEGFDFESITPDQAEAISHAGWPDIVAAFESRGAVCDA